MRESLRQYIRSNGLAKPLRILAQTSEKYLRSYYNEDFYDGAKNGEDRVVSLVIEEADGADEFVVLDVGAHHGFWSALVLERSPSAQVFCFEIVSPVRDLLKQRFADTASVQVLDYGLSSGLGQVDVTHNLTHDSTSSITPHVESKYFKDSDLVVRHEAVDTGDNFVSQRGIRRIDLLKIDTEGHEVDVLHGFSHTLGTAAAPRVIQFEYGQTFLPFRHTLHEVYELLIPHGYEIGRLFPDRVDFKPYELADDHFRMGNYIAVKTSDPLRGILSRQRAAL